MRILRRLQLEASSGRRRLRDAVRPLPSERNHEPKNLNLPVSLDQEGMELPLPRLVPGQHPTKSLNEVVQVGYSLPLRRRWELDAPLAKVPILELEGTRYLGSTISRTYENLRATSGSSLDG